MVDFVPPIFWKGSGFRPSIVKKIAVSSVAHLISMAVVLSMIETGGNMTGGLTFTTNNGRDDIITNSAATNLHHSDF